MTSFVVEGEVSRTHCTGYVYERAKAGKSKVNGWQNGVHALL